MSSYKKSHYSADDEGGFPICNVKLVDLPKFNFLSQYLLLSFYNYVLIVSCFLYSSFIFYFCSSFQILMFFLFKTPNLFMLYLLIFYE